MLEPTITVSDEQVAFYRAHGYLAVTQSLSTPAELARVRAIYDRLFQEMTGWEQGAAFDLAGTDEDPEAALPQILGPSNFAPELKETLYYANAQHIAERLLGPECRAGGDHAILKPAHHGAPAPWHQDEAYWDPNYDHCGLSVWVPLQEATLENGCMWFVPGTQRLDVLPHHTINHDPRIHALELDGLDRMQHLIATAVPCPLPPGGATFHASRTFHYTGPNRSDQPRRAHILGFSCPPTPRAKPRANTWNEQKHTAREERRKAWQSTQKA